MRYNQQHFLDTRAPGVKTHNVLISRQFFYSFITPLSVRGVVLFTLFFSIACSAAAHQYEAEPESATCNVQKIQQQQRNAPGQLIKTDASSVPVQEANHLAVHQAGNTARQYRYKIIRRLPHSTTAFTQGLTFYNHYLFEGTGLLGRSEIRKLETKTGKLLKSIKTDNLAFGEGISIKNNRLIQLSWKSEKAYIYDVETFSLIREAKYKGEGWGVTYIDDKILISDGSSLLWWHNAEDLTDTEVNEYIRVTASGIALQGINELEYANGFIYANIWPTDCIAEIDPSNGNVTAWINLSDLYPAKSRTDWNAVLNGIAYQRDRNVFYVTGKYWPYIYVIALQQPQSTQLDKTQGEKTGSTRTENLRHGVFASLQN